MKVKEGVFALVLLVAIFSILLNGCGQQNQTNQSLCGNNVCETNETSLNCCVDCNCPNNYNCSNNSCIYSLEGPFCGDSVCQTNENSINCCKDCGCASESYCSENNTCINSPNWGPNFCGGLTSTDIINIAKNSSCVENATLNITKEFSCNNYTDTAWIGLDIIKSGCNPACVVNVSSRQAEINWRCAGAIPGNHSFSIRTDKTSYTLNESIKMIGESPSTVYWDKNRDAPTIYQKIGNDWQNFSSYIRGRLECESINLSYCPPHAGGFPPYCSEVNNSEIWVWNQKYIIKDVMNCTFMNTTRNEYCYHIFSIEPGTYKIEFTYYTDCENNWPKEDYKETVFTNEFIII